MSRLFMSGFDLDPDVGNLEILGPVGTTITMDTSFKRSGLASAKMDSGVGAATSELRGSFFNDSVTQYIRCYFCFANLPGSTVPILYMHGNPSTNDGVSARITSAGKLQLWNNNAGGSQLGSDSSATISADSTTWYRVEISTLVNGSFIISDAELRLDGVTVAAESLLVAATGVFSLGWCATPGTNKIMWMDDMGVNTSAGGSNTTWLGDGKVILMRPASDSQRGSWTGGSGGTTNLWDAVNNLPPTGTASENDTTQIESTDSSGDNATDEYRGDCGSYTAAGIGANDTINAIQTRIAHGEDVGTNTKTGSYGLQANPAAAYKTFTFGNDGGALGTYPTGWGYSPGTMQDAPSVTKGNSLILAVRKTDAGTRVASVCFLGAYVDYTPAVDTAIPPDLISSRRTPRRRVLQRM